MEGNAYTPGGGGTSHLAIVNCTIYGEDAHTGAWFTLVLYTGGSYWQASSLPPTAPAKVNGRCGAANGADHEGPGGRSVQYRHGFFGYGSGPWNWSCAGSQWGHNGNLLSGFFGQRKLRRVQRR